LISVRRSLNKYELGIFEPPIDKMIKLAEHLNVSLDYLILGEAQKQLEFKNRELLSKLSDIEKLSQDDQQTLLKMIDALIVQQKVESAIKKK
jgi:transcriptional regulator with XRE-family HTH domain